MRPLEVETPDQIRIFTHPVPRAGRNLSLIHIYNRSRFIVKRIFAEEFVVVRRDPSKVQFVARLNDFYYQFQKLGNNCAPVKVI